MNFGRADIMAVAAVRYCMGRSSYIVGDCADWLKENWQEISDRAKQTITRDLRNALDQDDHDRITKQAHNHLGHDMDKAIWLDVMVFIQQQEIKQC